MQTLILILLLLAFAILATMSIVTRSSSKRRRTSAVRQRREARTTAARPSAKEGAGGRQPAPVPRPVASQGPAAAPAGPQAPAAEPPRPWTHLDLSLLTAAPEDGVLPGREPLDAEGLKPVLEQAKTVSDQLRARRAIIAGLSAASEDPAELSKLVLSDPALAGQILKTVNSAFYALSYPVASVFRAVLLLGYVEIRNIIWRVSVADSASQGEGPASSLLDELWRHSFDVSRVAYAIAKSLGLKEPDEISTAALLHDVGKIVALTAWPEKGLGVFDPVRFSTREDLEREIELVGINHAALGGEIVRTWGLPRETASMIELHHVPSYVAPRDIEAEEGEDVHEKRRGMAVIHTADVLCHCASAPEGTPIYQPPDGWLTVLRVRGGLDTLCNASVLRILAQQTRASTTRSTRAAAHEASPGEEAAGVAGGGQDPAAHHVSEAT
jgi:putative nucleotidyltransferase with HDIG domain